MGLFDFLRAEKRDRTSENDDSQMPQDDVVFFPDLNFVFKEVSDALKNVFFPVLSIRLSTINKDWGDGFIHLIQFNEDPYNTGTVKYYTDYCRDNMISFSLEDGKYAFSTDLKFLEVTADWKKYLEETKASYQKSKAKYEEDGETFNLADIRIGGDPEWWQSDATPLDPDGNQMMFITEIETYPFCPDSCDKKLFLFYSHKHKLAVQLYQTT